MILKNYNKNIHISDRDDNKMDSLIGEEVP